VTPDVLHIRWAEAGRPLLGSMISGDRAVVVETSASVLVAVVDGLGHGEPAAVAADRAASVLVNHAGTSISTVVERCHEALVTTRGAALSIAAFDLYEHTVSWLGVGNVAGVLVRADQSRRSRMDWLALYGGIVGARLPLLRPVVLPVWPDDMLILATDGLRDDWPNGELRGEPQRVANQLLAGYGVSADDALVLVARCYASRSCGHL
jgi:negative regulator of sigma-B (phosphoserine phosphatase)